MKNIIKQILRENTDKTITCKNKKCGWHWKHSQGGPDMYFCHKCGTDNTPDNIDEAARQMGDLPEDAALFVTDNATWIYFILYSKSEDKIYATITTSDIKDSNKLQEVGRVAAEKGYGPLIYEMAMAYINPGYLMPSRDGDIRGAAWSVWEKFYQRKDIIKKTLPLEDELFSFVIVTGDSHEDFESIEEKQEIFNELSQFEKNQIIVFNTMFQFKNGMILKLIYKADEQVKNGDVDINKLKFTAAQYFETKYH